MRPSPDDAFFMSLDGTQACVVTAGKHHAVLSSQAEGVSGSPALPSRPVCFGRREVVFSRGSGWALPEGTGGARRVAARPLSVCTAATQGPA